MEDKIRTDARQPPPDASIIRSISGRSGHSLRRPKPDISGTAKRAPCATPVTDTALYVDKSLHPCSVIPEVTRPLPAANPQASGIKTNRLSPEMIDSGVGSELSYSSSNYSSKFSNSCVSTDSKQPFSSYSSSASESGEQFASVIQCPKTTADLFTQDITSVYSPYAGNERVSALRSSSEDHENRHTEDRLTELHEQHNPLYATCGDVTRERSEVGVYSKTPGQQSNSSEFGCVMRHRNSNDATDSDVTRREQLTSGRSSSYHAPHNADGISGKNKPNPRHTFDGNVPQVEPEHPSHALPTHRKLTNHRPASMPPANSSARDSPASSGSVRCSIESETTRSSGYAGDKSNSSASGSSLEVSSPRRSDHSSTQSEGDTDPPPGEGQTGTQSEGDTDPPPGEGHTGTQSDGDTDPPPGEGHTGTQSVEDTDPPPGEGHTGTQSDGGTDPPPGEGHTGTQSEGTRSPHSLPLPHSPSPLLRINRARTDQSKRKGVVFSKAVSKTESVRYSENDYDPIYDVPRHSVVSVTSDDVLRQSMISTTSDDIYDVPRHSAVSVTSDHVLRHSTTSDDIYNVPRRSVEEALPVTAAEMGVQDTPVTPGIESRDVLSQVTSSLRLPDDRGSLTSGAEASDEPCSDTSEGFTGTSSGGDTENSERR